MALNIDDSDDENDDDDDEEEDDDEDNDDNNINSDEDDLEEEEDDETDEVSTLLNTDYHICVNVHVAQRIWFYIKIYILNIYLTSSNQRLGECVRPKMESQVVAKEQGCWQTMPFNKPQMVR